jgi:hypothetical protein
VRRDDVKYALLIYAGTTEESIGQLSALEQTAILNEYRALAQEHDVYGSEQLQSVDTATTVRIENGRTLVSDAESGCPDIGGLYLLEAEDIDRALELAERIPAARLGGAVEIRPNIEREPSQ